MVSRHLAASLIAALGFLGRGEGNCGGSKEPPKEASSGAASASAAPVREVTLEGVDTSALTGTEKAAFSTYASEFLAPCSDTPVPVAQCVQEKRACAKCLPAAKFIVLGIRRGYPKSKLEEAYKNRFDADRVKNVPIEGSPSMGPESAPITMVEFADFECPHCGAMAPVLDKVVERYQGQVRFFYKFLPLPSHPHAESAAFAAFAAMKQGKFWEMHHKIYENQLKLDLSDLEAYATELGLELGRFRVDMRSTAAKQHVEADKKAADTLKIQATPTVFINGREHSGPEDYDEWIASELAMMGIAAKGSAASEGGGSDSGAGGPSKPSDAGSDAARNVAPGAAKDAGKK